MKEIEKEFLPVIAIAKSIKVVDKQSLEVASEVREKIKEAIKRTKDNKEFLYRPWKNKIDAINDLYKPLEKQLDSILKDLNTGMSAYQTAIFTAQKLKEAKIAKAMSKGKIDVDTAIDRINEVKKVEDTDLTGFVKKQKLEIINLSKIPREFLIPDEKKILDALKNGLSVTGARIIEVMEPRSK